MSLAIDADLVIAVLLSDGWHDVEDQSFDLDAYEFVLEPDGSLLHRGGASGICATGFSFVEGDGSRVSGPLTSVLAVRGGRP